MRSDLFMHEMTKTSAVFGRKSDVKVAFDMKGARTDGRTVYLPVLPLGKEVSEETMAVMRGYVDHEARHVRDTDSMAKGKATEGWIRRGQRFREGIWNGLEDVRIERDIIREYPGAEKNLRATTEAVNRDTLKAIGTGELPMEVITDPFTGLGVALTWEGRLGYGGVENQTLKDLLPEAIKARLPGWIERVGECRSTADTIKLADAIAVELLAMYDYDPRGEPKVSEGEGEGEGEDEGEGEGEGGEDDGLPKLGREAIAKKMKAEPFEPDRAKALEKRLKGEELDGRKWGEYAPPSTEHDRWWHRTTETWPGSAGSIKWVLTEQTAAQYDELVGTMTGEVSVMRRGLERALLAMLNRDWVGSQEMGRLDTRRLAAAVAGRTSVFKTRSERPEIDTAVTFLVDLSGSMGGARMDLAAKATIGMVEALAKTGVSIEVLGFQQVRGYMPGVKDLSTAGTTIYRYEPLDMLIFKSFEERLFAAKGALAGLVGAANGNNCDGEAVMLAYDRLRRRPEKRKVMFVLSDGNPCCATDKTGALYEHLRQSVAYVEAQGTEVVAIGIQTESVKEYYRRCLVVSDLGELATKSMGVLGGLLLGDRRRRVA